MQELGDIENRIVKEISAKSTLEINRKKSFHLQMLNLSNLKWLYMYQKIGSKDMQKKYLEKIK